MAAPDVGNVLDANRDIDVDPDVAARYSALKSLITDSRFRETFDQHDVLAKRAKRRYTIVGTCSVVLAVVALEFEVLALALDGVGHSVPRWASLVFPAMAILSVVLIVSAHLAGLRRKWLVEVFVRERLRQWRHQLLLDGKLMDLARSNPSSYQREVTDRWSDFCELVRTARGKFHTFIDTPGADQYWFVTASVPHDQEVRSQVLRLQALVRLAYQLDFGEAKVAVGGGGRPGIADITKAAEWGATTTLVGAVVVSVSVFASRVWSGHHHAVDVWLAASAVGLAVLSLGIRAVRTGLTIPYEQQSYEEYINRCQVLRESFRRAQGNDNKQWDVLKDLETSAGQELRRFLRMKWDARFIV